MIADFTDGQRGVYAGLGQALLLFLALWAVWSLTVWSTSWLDPEAPIVQTVIVMTVVGAMTMAVAVPDGFGARAALFAITYVTLQIGRVVYFHIAGHGRPDPQQTIPGPGLVRPERTALGSSAGWSTTGTVRGGALDPRRADRLHRAVPRAGRPRASARNGIGGQLIAAEHLAERYQQFLLIAIGEAIFVIGLAFSGSEFHADQTGGFVLALATTVLLWRIYFHCGGRDARTRPSAAPATPPGSRPTWRSPTWS